MKRQRREIFPYRPLLPETPGVSVLGDIADVLCSVLLYVQRTDFFAVEVYFSRIQLPQADERFRKLRLAVAVDTGNAKDLALFH